MKEPRNTDIEKRLHKFLEKSVSQQPPLNLEDRIMNRIAKNRQPRFTWRAWLGGSLLVTTAVTAAVAGFALHSSNTGAPIAKARPTAAASPINTGNPASTNQPIPPEKAITGLSTLTLPGEGVSVLYPSGWTPSTLGPSSLVLTKPHGAGVYQLSLGLGNIPQPGDSSWGEQALTTFTFEGQNAYIDKDSIGSSLVVSPCAPPGYCLFPSRSQPSSFGLEVSLSYLASSDQQQSSNLPNDPSTLNQAQQIMKSLAYRSPTTSPGAPVVTPASAASLSVPSSDPNGPQKIADILYPTTGPNSGELGGGSPSCVNKSTSGHDYTGCPISARLAARVDNPPYSDGPHGQGPLLCGGCNASWDQKTVTVTPTSEGANVHVLFNSNDPIYAQFALDLKVVKTSQAWLVDDILVTLGGPYDGGSATGHSVSVYNNCLITTGARC